MQFRDKLTNILRICKFFYRKNRSSKKNRNRNRDSDFFIFHCSQFTMNYSLFTMNYEL